ncbi:hypothetical protein B296_00010140 [Ensete ventricosum]|uniref:Uncharacterized protein n=1 Tax=Ensete ventricosum TaxID=4639 RepID=A0A426ZF62_ENSVE|nr:hypothetical protein B296_00010140 [Ensete ventricosum]
MPQDDVGWRLTERKALLVQVEKKRKQPAMMSDAALLAVHCNLAEPISAKQRKKEMKQSNGNSGSMYAIGNNDCKCQKEEATCRRGL